MSRSLVVAAGLACAAVAASAAEFKFASVISDNAVLQRDVAAPVWGFGEPGKTVAVALDGKLAGEATVAADGRWTVKLPVQKANKNPSKITATCAGETVSITNVLFGDVWFGCGQSNMAFAFDSFGWKAVGAKEFVAKGGNPLIRTLLMNDGENRNAIKPRADAVGISWKTASAESLASFGAALYWMGDRLQRDLDVPIGLVDAAWGATSIQTWLDAAWSEGHGKGHAMLMGRMARGNEKNPNAKLNAGTPCSMFNGLVHPLYPMAIKGAVWYQGESNLGFDTQWRLCMEAIASGWREHFTHGEKFPVILTAIAPHEIGGRGSSSRDRIAKGETGSPTWSVVADMRRCIVETALDIPDGTFVSLIDLGEPDIHPVRKREVGERWAAAALQNAYGKPIPGTSPAVTSVEWKGAKAVLRLKDAKGLAARDGQALKGFELGGPVAPGEEIDKSTGKPKEGIVYHCCDAKIVGETIELSCPKVAEAFSFRYAWFDLDLGWNVVNGAGLPLESCRGYKDGQWHPQIYSARE